ncbi:hypothetical protein DFJ73DRAFT_784549 [Zopfochytrium polystomum]|nr:hypothetical protein DFJ73DRAFT_784549 [Zopfochytrium polystomum]
MSWDSSSTGCMSTYCGPKYVTQVGTNWFWEQQSQISYYDDTGNHLIIKINSNSNTGQISPAGYVIGGSRPDLHGSAWWGGDNERLYSYKGYTCRLVAKYGTLSSTCKDTGDNGGPTNCASTGMLVDKVMTVYGVPGPFRATDSILTLQQGFDLGYPYASLGLAATYVGSQCGAGAATAGVTADTFSWLLSAMDWKGLRSWQTGSVTVGTGEEDVSELLLGNHCLSNEFLSNARNYNSLMAFASVGANIKSHGQGVPVFTISRQLQGGFEVENWWVVAFNRYLSRKYQSHFNVEIAPP